MPNENHADTNSDQEDQKKNYISQPAIKRILWGSCALLALLLVATFFLPSGRILFFTGGFLGLATLVVIALQSVTYSAQWEAMNEGLAIERAKTDPRLRIAEVRAENFQDGKRPVFIVTIANDGLIAATGVRIHMEVFIGTDKEIGWIHAPVVSIPANGQEHYFIRSSAWLTEEQIVAFNNDVPLKVVGYFEYRPVGRTDFCYKYVPWDEERPSNIPQFVPCDFEPRLNITLHVSGIEAKVTLHAAGLVIKKDPEDAEPQENPANSNNKQQDS